MCIANATCGSVVGFAVTIVDARQQHMLSDSIWRAAVPAEE
jgi:hypothetical protein